MNLTPTVKQLLIINVILFIAASQMPFVQRYFPLYYFENDTFRFWQPLTHMFMHGNLTHILFNMFALYSFGSALEHFWGAKKFLFFYISCGLGAALLHTGANYFQFNTELQALLEAGYSKSDIINTLNENKFNTQWETIIGQSGIDSLAGSFAIPAVGASGAIYGLLVAFAFMFPNAELAMLFIPIPIKAKYFVTGLIVIDLILGLKGQSIFGGSGTGIAHFAHVGGALTGFIVMWYWKKSQFKRNRWN